MNIKLKQGETFTHPVNGSVLTEAYGYIRHQSFTVFGRKISSGTADIKGNASINIYTYDLDNMEKNFNPYYEYSFNVNTEIAITNNLLVIDPVHGFMVSEKGLYEYLINNVEFFANFEIQA